MSPNYAWPTYADEWLLELQDLVLDDAPRPDLLDAEHSRLRIDDERWNGLTFLVTAQTTEPDPAVLGIQAHLLVTAAKSHLRLPVQLNQDSESWTAVVRLSRDVLAGAAHASVEITGLVDGRRRLLGRSQEWTIVVDASAAPTPPGAPPFTMTWIDFTADDAPVVVREAADVPAVFDMSTAPVLYLNSGIEGLHELLHADHAKGNKRLARDVVGAEVARYAVASLVRSAAAEVVRNSEGDEVTPPDDRVLRQTLDAVARHLASAVDTEDLCARIVTAENGPIAERVAFWAQVDAAVARMSGASVAVGELVRAVRFA